MEQSARRFVRFPSPRHWRDLPFAVLFVLQLFVVVGVFFWGFFSLPSAPSSDFCVWLASLPNSQLLAYGGVVCTVAFTATAWALFARSLIMLAPRAMIYVGFVTNAVACLGAAIVLLVFQQWLFAAVSALIAIVNIINAVRSADFVEFTVVLLSYVASVFKQRSNGALIFSAGVFLLQLYLSLFYCLTIAYSQRIEFLSGPLTLIHLIASFFWTQAVLQLLSHTVTAGFFSEVYFHGQQRASILSSFKRTATVSFGTICFGSLTSWLVRLIRSFLYFAFERDERPTEHQFNGGGAGGDCFGEIVQAILHVIAYSFTRSLSAFTFAFAAIYVTPLSLATRKVSKLFDDQKCVGMGNDLLVRGVLLATSITGGLFGAGTSLLVSRTWHLTYDAHAYAPHAAAFLGFIIGFAFVIVFLEPIDGGVSSILVCFADSPERMELVRPEIQEAIAKLYPAAAAAKEVSDRETIV